MISFENTMRFSKKLILVLIFFTLGICSSRIGQADDAAKPSSDWSIKVELMEQSDQPLGWGAPIVVSVMITNTSGSTLYLPSGDVFSMTRYQVGRVTPKKDIPSILTAYGVRQLTNSKFQEFTSTRVEPDETITQHVHLNRLFDMTLGGKHRLIVSKLIVDKTGLVQVFRSNELEIVIEDPPKSSGKP